MDGYPRFLLGEITDRSLFINTRGPEREQEAGGNLNNAKKISLSHACTAMQIFLDFKTFPHPLISRYISELIPLQLKKNCLLPGEDNCSGSSLGDVHLLTALSLLRPLKIVYTSSLEEATTFSNGKKVALKSNLKLKISCYVSTH